jgi:hypothetical protein
MRATRQLQSFATFEVTSLESSYARIIRVDTGTAEPTTNVAENHNDVLQTANLLIRGSPRDHFFNCARALQEPFHKPLKQRRARSNFKLAKAINLKVLDRRYVTDQCSSVLAGPRQARRILIQAQATLISLPSNHTEEITIQYGSKRRLCRFSPGLRLAPGLLPVSVPLGCHRE